jgi:hypothetical protein
MSQEFRFPAAGIISSAERLRRHSARYKQHRELAADLRLASLQLRFLASLVVAEEAGRETDPVRHRQLVAEALALRDEAKERQH